MKKLILHRKRDSCRWQNLFNNAFCDYKSDCDRKQGAVVSRNSAKEKTDSSLQSENRTIVVTKTDSEKSSASSGSEIVYKIQIMVSPKKYGEKNSCFKGLSPVSYYRENGLYTYGETTDRKKLLQELPRVRKLFKDAFIVSFKDGVKVK